MIKNTIPVEDAVGMVIPHDITEIVKDTFKGVAFSKGHIIKEEDIPHLKRLGKNHIYVLDLKHDEIHEDEAATLLANALAGPGVTQQGPPQEGKISFTASTNGLLKINTEALFDFNMLGEVMCSTLQSNTPVSSEEIVAGTRLIPLITQRKIVEQACQIALSSKKPILQVLPFEPCKVALIITGTEIYEGLVEDKFEKILREKLQSYGSTLKKVFYAPDKEDIIAERIQDCLNNDIDLIITSGGMSVDPDDVTRGAIRRAGVDSAIYGSPVLPGAMFLVGKMFDTPIIGLPACGMFHKITIFDLVLPRILTGEEIRREDIAKLGHGGLCRNCKDCRYPICSFGK